METRFTPGPWIRDPEDKLRITTEDLLNAGDCIANVETYADARLIVAAPDLYNALNYIVNWNNNGWSAEQARNMAQAALAKARGEA